MLYTLSQLVMEFPEAADVFHLRTQEAELRVPTRMAGQADLSVSRIVNKSINNKGNMKSPVTGGKKPQLGTPVSLTSYDLRM